MFVCISFFPIFFSLIFFLGICLCGGKTFSQVFPKRNKNLLFLLAINYVELNVDLMQIQSAFLQFFFFIFMFYL